MIRIYTAADLPDAHIVLGLLQHAGIEARVLNEHARGGLGDIPFGEAYPQVWIENERDLERARGLIREYEMRQDDKRTLRCPACGEESPATFELCWNCGAKL